MLQRFITMILISGICCTSIAQVPEAAEIKNNKIKKITATYKYSGEPDIIVATYYYNENGDDTAYYDNGNRTYYNVIDYNRKLQPLTISKFFPDGKAMDKTVFTYKPDGSFTSVNTDTQFGMKVTENYDKKGRLMSHSIPDGTVIKYVYNAKGQLTSSYSIPARGEKKATTSYTYNPKGKMISSATKGAFNSKITYEYDTKGLLKKSTSSSVSESGEKHVSTVEYDYGY